MSTKLIQLQDGIFVEAEVPQDAAQEISGGLASKVNSSWDSIEPILLRIVQPISNTLKAMSQEMEIESAEIELGLSFEGEGNLYVTKSKATANLSVKFSLKPKRS